MNDDQVRFEELYQVMARDAKTKKLVAVPCFPRVMKKVAEGYVETMRSMIAVGKEKRYEDPHIAMHLGHRNT